MNRRLLLLYSGLIAGVMVLAAMVAGPPAAPLDRSGPMTLPPDYRETFIHYATVDRSDDITRRLLIDPAALAALRDDQPLPQGTRLIIEAYEAAGRDADGRLIPGDLSPNIHMAEKRDDWLLSQLPVSSHVGDWNFGAFDQASGQDTGENLNDCFTCHDASARQTRDFVFTRRLIDAFARTGEVQHAVCHRPERVPCGF